MKEFEVKYKNEDGSKIVKEDAKAVKNLTIGFKQMCWEHCVISDCPKLLARWNEKKDIDEYEFIKEGIQVKDEEGRLEHLLISKCDLYKKAEKKKKISSLRLTEIIHDLELDYFKADTFEQAARTRKAWIASGLLKDKGFRHVESIKKPKGKYLKRI